MLLKMSDWEKIREHFSEQEKEVLNASITREAICPRGCIIDTDMAGMVAIKIRRKLDELYHPELYRGK